MRQTLSKPIRDVVALVIQNDKKRVLFGFRSSHKSVYPSQWSIPSAYVAKGEQVNDTMKRIGIQKLGVDLQIEKLLNEGQSDQGDYIRFMHVYKASIVTGRPKLVSNDYSELKWFEPRKQLDSMNIEGDCTRLYKEYLDTLI